jgi:hypothetical protein
MKDEPFSPAPLDDDGPAAVLSAQSALRLVLILLAVWTAFSGLALVLFQSGSAATIGGGIDGGEGVAAQRLLGVHLLVLAPLYGLLAWDPARHRRLLWLPYAAQGGVVVVTLYDIMAGDRDIQDGMLPLIVAATFLVLLVYVWRAARPAGHVSLPMLEGEVTVIEPEPPQPPARFAEADDTGD